MSHLCLLSDLCHLPMYILLYCISHLLIYSYTHEYYLKKRTLSTVLVYVWLFVSVCEFTHVRMFVMTHKCTYVLVLVSILLGYKCVRKHTYSTWHEVTYGTHYTVVFT